MNWMWAGLCGFLLGLFIGCAASAHAIETPTQWIYRTVPTSMTVGDILRAVVKCPSGRDYHLKSKGPAFRVWCPGPK